MPSCTRTATALSARRTRSAVLSTRSAVLRARTWAARAALPGGPRPARPRWTGVRGRRGCATSSRTDLAARRCRATRCCSSTGSEDRDRAISRLSEESSDLGSLQRGAGFAAAGCWTPSWRPCIHSMGSGVNMFRGRRTVQLACSASAFSMYRSSRHPLPRLPSNRPVVTKSRTLFARAVSVCSLPAPES